MVGKSWGYDEDHFISHRNYSVIGLFDDGFRGAGIQAALSPIQKILNNELQQMY